MAIVSANGVVPHQEDNFDDFTCGMKPKRFLILWFIFSALIITSFAFTFGFYGVQREFEITTETLRRERNEPFSIPAQNKVHVPIRTSSGEIDERFHAFFNTKTGILMIKIKHDPTDGVGEKSKLYQLVIDGTSDAFPLPEVFIRKYGVDNDKFQRFKRKEKRKEIQSDSSHSSVPEGMLTEKTVNSDHKVSRRNVRNCSPAGKNKWRVLAKNHNGEANEQFDAIFDDVTRYVTIKCIADTMTNQSKGRSYQLIVEEITTATDARIVKIPSHPEVDEDGWVSAFVMDPVTNEIVCANQLNKKPIEEEAN